MIAIIRCWSKMSRLARDCTDSTDLKGTPLAWRTSEISDLVRLLKTDVAIESTIAPPMTLNCETAPMPTAIPCL